ncbi:MAG: sigma factor, partial [Catonella sp.]
MNFERFSDEELCEKAKEGDGKAENYLLNKYKNMVRSKAKTLYLLGGDREDLIQEGMIGLFMAVRDFDKTKNTSFSTFANLVCERRMYNAI